MTLSNIQTIDISVKSAKLNDLKILHLSDLHINKKTSLENVQNLVKLCNEFGFCLLNNLVSKKYFFCID